MAGGRLWGTLFFLFMTFASFTTVIAVFENILANFMELMNISRRRAAVIGGVIIFIASMPCVLGFNVLSAIKPLGGTSTIFDGEDFVVSNLLLPIGSLIYLLFCVTHWGWGFDQYLQEANTGAGIKLPRWLKTGVPVCAAGAHSRDPHSGPGVTGEERGCALHVRAR